MRFGLKVKLKRIELGLTQRELSEKINVTVSSLQKYEANKRQPQIGTMKKISEILGVSVQELFFSEEK